MLKPPQKPTAGIMPINGLSKGVAVQKMTGAGVAEAMFGPAPKGKIYEEYLNPADFTLGKVNKKDGTQPVLYNNGPTNRVFHPSTGQFSTMDMDGAHVGASLFTKYIPKEKSSGQEDVIGQVPDESSDDEDNIDLSLPHTPHCPAFQSSPSIQPAGQSGPTAVSGASPKNNPIAEEELKPSILRNIGSIPVAVAVWLLGIPLTEHMVMRYLHGEDPDNDKFFFFIPIEPIAVWVVPLIQFLVVPGACVYTAAYVASSKRIHFAAAVAILLSIMNLVTALEFTLGPFDEPGVAIFRLWLCTVIGWASSAVSLVLVYEEFRTSKAGTD